MPPLVPDSTATMSGSEKEEKVEGGSLDKKDGDKERADVKKAEKEKKYAAEAKEKAESTRVIRYDEVFDYRSYTWKLVKSAKPKKKNNKKPILVVRRLFDYKNRHTGTKVDIKSKGLVEVLGECNEDVEGLGLNANPPSADPSLFYHSREHLMGVLEREKGKGEGEGRDGVLVEDLETAINFLQEEHGKAIAGMSTLLPAEECTWDLLWALFKPSSLVYHYHKYTQEDQVLLFRKMKKKQRQDGTLYWLISCDVVADSGVRFGLGSYPEPLEIDAYEGARPIEDLLIVPLRYTGREKELKEDLTERGKKYAGLKGPTYWEISGLAVREERNQKWETKRFSFNAYGRVIIDSSSFNTHQPDCEYVSSVHRVLDRDKLTDDQLLICPPYALGFSFGNKRWGGYAVSHLKPVHWGHEAFNSLVLESRRKNLIHSLVKQHSLHADKYDDFVEGKGRGLVILLSGKPGCGKTLTAEAVAEVTKKPLYMVSAGELGTSPEDVDKALTLALELAHKWEAVLLLDEADVFLQARNTADLNRNALVSIFLRQLEYYKGILVLTTNRVADCDPAFESRIHVSLHYPDLDFDARREIWKSFITKVQAGETNPGVISSEEIDSLASHTLNGRQIKNLIASARSIAREEGVVLDASHITTVLEVMTAWSSVK